MFIIGCVFFIFVSKELFVFNAESLVLLTFSLFVTGLVFFFRDSVVAFFERSNLELDKKFHFQRWLIVKAQMYQRLLFLARTKSSWYLWIYPLLLQLMEIPLKCKAEYELRGDIANQIMHKMQLIKVLENKNTVQINSLVTSDLQKKLCTNSRWPKVTLYVESLKRLYLI
uniref:ATP synthase F0 subunit b n=1 Tax=Goniomonas avonlea TaxID=1255295 RepID=A0A348G6M7_9CRYP|nr:ATP synthase F0 subunit b [Goniomonas avonlea]